MVQVATGATCPIQLDDQPLGLVVTAFFPFLLQRTLEFFRALLRRHLVAIN